jgi:hypothetical protein
MVRTLQTDDVRALTQILSFGSQDGSRSQILIEATSTVPWQTSLRLPKPPRHPV